MKRSKPQTAQGEGETYLSLTEEEEAAARAKLREIEQRYFEVMNTKMLAGPEIHHVKEKRFIVQPVLQVLSGDDLIEDLDRLRGEVAEFFNKHAIPEADKKTFIEYLFNGVASPETPLLPDVAPQLYTLRHDKNEKPVEFIRRVYEPWLGKGLSQPHIHKIDKQLYMALHNWLRNNTLPDDLDLPTKSEMVTRELEQTGPEVFREADRLRKSAYNRRKRSQKNSME